MVFCDSLLDTSPRVRCKFLRQLEFFVFVALSGIVVFTRYLIAGMRRIAEQV